MRLSVRVDCMRQNNVSRRLDRPDPEATTDDQAVTLLPGETRTFTITSSKELRLEDLTARPVMQVANFYGRG